ncbi:hypothetical protein [Paenibacillus sp. YAF4_2]|uniref:hypothetical protein n=1 Tax=Paenibacillus sp. YAF4_2 TaxID=3233085 RepID=UPI003F99B56F
MDVVELGLPCAEVKVIDLRVVIQSRSGGVDTAVNTAVLYKPAELIKRAERARIIHDPVQGLLVHARCLHNARRHLLPAGNNPFVISHTVKPIIHLINKVAVEP